MGRAATEKNDSSVALSESKNAREGLGQRGAQVNGSLNTLQPGFDGALLRVGAQESSAQSQLS
jgi:hypothetical protein